VQRSYYNGHYGFAGAKVQHVLQADGMCYSFTCPLRRHDAMVLRESSMLTMLSVMYVNDDPLRPVKCVTDKAYGRTNHLRPLHTSVKDLLLADWMNLAQVAIEHGIIHQDHSSPEVTVMEEFGDRNGTIPFTATKAKAWFLQQTDFNNESPRYKTNAFVYDPYNEKIRELMTTFWAHYSQENDVSWKDQPLYRYLLSKLRIQPASFPSIDEEKRTGEIKDFWEDDWEEDIHFLGSN
jgi:hypothetical protein